MVLDIILKADVNQRAFEISALSVLLLVSVSGSVLMRQCQYECWY